jgi:hypothetical protein
MWDNPATAASTAAAESARMLHRVATVDRANMVLLLSERVGLTSADS